MAHSSSVSPPSSLPDPPGAWSPARRLARAAIAPVERFLAIEASSGLVLIAAAAIALGLANSPLRDAYAHLWHTPIGIRFGAFAFERDLHFWVNDGLMTIFFFVVGLEIRREIAHGELSELRRAALPIAAAVGGMVVPALLFVALNRGGAGHSGWGIPMATDIAFAVGVLTLLGKNVAPALRILLLALAVIDDLGAILVIALFYSQGIDPHGFAVVGAGIGTTLLMQKIGARAPVAYLVPGIVTWAGALVLGIHPTLAGVIMGLLTPVKAWFGSDAFVERAATNIDEIRAKAPSATEHELMPHLDAINAARREAVAPVERLQHALHGWVAYGIMPVFALANAGVPLGSATLDGDGLRVFLGVGLGLAIGKPIGVLVASRALVALGAGALPSGVAWKAVSVVGAVAGIGFTMALFVAQLALPPGPLLETAKLGILAGSAVSAIAGFIVGRIVLRGALPEDCAKTDAEAEASTAR